MNATHPFVVAVAHLAVLVARPRERVVALVFVCADRRACLDIRNDMLFQRSKLRVGKEPRGYVGPALNHAEHDGFAERTTTFPTRTLTANERLVNFNVTGKPAVTVNLVHVLTDQMSHPKRCWVAHSKLALQFLRRNAMA